MPCGSKNAFLAPFPPGSPEGTRGKGVYVDQMVKPFDRRGCATAPFKRIMIRLSCFSDEIAPALEDQIRVIRELGMRYLEVRTVENNNVLSLEDSMLYAIKNACDENGLAITCVSSAIGKERADCPMPELLDRLRKACRIADIFCCRYIRVFSFFKRDIPKENAFSMSLERLRAMAGIAMDQHKILVMESGKDTLGARSADALRLFQAIGSPALRCAFDMAAFMAAGDDPYEQSLPALMSYIGYVHVKDMHRGSSSRVPAGEGDTRVKDIVNALKEKPLVFSLEPHLAYAGEKGGFSGEENFKKAHAAFIGILQELGIDYE